MRRLALVTMNGTTGRPSRGAARRPRRSAARLPRVVGYLLCLALLVAGLALGRVEFAPAEDDAAAGPAVDGAVRVIDGDTLDVAGERVRIANIDTPEMPPKARCASEADGALRARDGLQALVASGPVVLERTGTDRYGRTLAHVSVNGSDAGRTLIAEGLARPWEGRRRSWCA